MLSSYSLPIEPAGTAFVKIYKYFVKKKHPVIVDLTVGEGYSWTKIEREDWENMTFYGLDNRVTNEMKKESEIKMPNHTWSPNVDNTMPLPFPSEIADFVYFDPPFYFTSEPTETGKPKYDADAKKLVFEEVFIDENIFNSMVLNLSSEVPRILKSGGYFLVKIMDSYRGRTFIPNAFNLAKVFSEKMQYSACYVVDSGLKNRTFLIYGNHIYYMVFRK